MNGLKRLDQDSIERCAELLLTKVDPRLISTPQPLPYRKVLDYLITNYGATIEYVDSLPRMGNYVACAMYKKESNTISVLEDLPYTSRFRHIISHEIGHLILHRQVDFDVKEYYEQSHERKFYDILTGKRELNNDSDFMEWQAGMFASALTIPRKRFKEKLKEIQKKMGISRVGYIYKNPTPHSAFDYHKTIALLAEIYGVAKMNIICRLRSLDLIKGCDRWIQGFYGIYLQTERENRSFRFYDFQGR